MAVAGSSRDTAFGSTPWPNPLGAFSQQPIGALARAHALRRKRPEPDSDSDEEYTPDNDGNYKKHNHNLISNDRKSLRTREKVNYNIEGIIHNSS